MFNSEPITRKKFATTIVKGIVATSIFGSLFKWQSKLPASSSNTQGCIRIKPLADKNYTRSFLKFCQKNRFTTVEEAVQSVRDPQVKYELCYESV